MCLPWPVHDFLFVSDLQFQEGYAYSDGLGFESLNTYEWYVFFALCMRLFILFKGLRLNDLTYSSSLPTDN